MHHDPDLQRQAGETTAENKLLALLKRWRWFGAFVVLPSLLGTLYFGFIAADIESIAADRTACRIYIYSLQNDIAVLQAENAKLEEKVHTASDRQIAALAGLRTD